MKIELKKEFADDFITREAGEKLRDQIVKELGGGKSVELDFSGLVIASTSFFDEGIAKLALISDLSKAVKNNLHFVGLHPRDKELLLSLCRKRNLEIIP